MLMKIILVVALVMAVGHVTGQQCNRKQTREHRTLLSATKCKNPQPSPVQLQVPEDFDYVTPSVVMVNQCTGMSCNAYHERCLPMPGETRPQYYTVYARKRNGVEEKCTTVEVEEHLACECRCDERDCPSNMVFNRDTCDCECNPHLKTRCENRRNVYGMRVMWSPKFCSCECNVRVQCGNHQFWDPESCLCESI